MFSNRRKVHASGMAILLFIFPFPELFKSSWLAVTKELLTFQIIRVLPDRHPSRPYTAELERRFRDVEGVFVQSHPAEVSWSSHIPTAADINSLTNKPIHPVNEFSSQGKRASYFTEDGCHIDSINLI